MGMIPTTKTTYSVSFMREVVAKALSMTVTQAKKEDGDDYDHEAFLEQMMFDLRKTAEDMTEAEIKRQREEKEAAYNKQKDMEESKFSDNNFWALPVKTTESDVD